MSDQDVAEREALDLDNCDEVALDAELDRAFEALIMVNPITKPFLMPEDW